MRLKVKVPATFGRLGWEIEGLGIAVSLYNEFYFEKAKNWEFIGFPKADNLLEGFVKKAMEKTYWYAKVSLPAYKVTLVQCIPIGRGLGFNASCVVGGVVAANYFLDRRFSLVNMLNIAATVFGTFEGISPALFGDLCSAYQFDGEIKNVKYQVEPGMTFTHLMSKNVKNLSSQATKTNIQDFSYRLTKAINLPKALETGNVNLLKELLAYQTNENNFFMVFSNESNLQRFCQESKYPYFVNDQDFTLTFISNQIIIPELRDLGIGSNWEFVSLSVDKKGAIYEAVL
jgi:homoserine kinase